jgi:hypothetical protein
MPNPSESITWRPHVSDPTILAWVITLAFFAAGVACVVRLRRPQPKRLSVVWVVSTGMFFFLAFNKQLDLQVLLIQWARAWTADHHWFRHRRNVQAAFVIVLAAMATGGILTFAWTLRFYWSGIRLALIGIACTLVVTLLRVAVLCHALDRLIYAIGTTPSTVHHRLEPLELIGPLCVLASVWLSRRANPPEPSL